MLIGVIADDFTGASDIGITLAKGLAGEGGLKTALFLETPDKPAGDDIDVGVVALKSRSLPAEDAVAQSLAACEWLLRQGCRQILFKYCSTFDSTPQGNIGPVAEALADKLGVKGVVVCPSFPDMGRTLYQGHLFVYQTLLNESGMQHHPLTPMTDPDIRRVLAAQSQGQPGFIPWQVVQQGAAAIHAALEERARQGTSLVVVDAITNEDLVTISAACADERLITGGSAIAQGLPHNFISRGVAQGSLPVRVQATGKGAILVGSCSRTTLKQIQYHAKHHPVCQIDVEAILNNRISQDKLVNFIVENSGKAPLLYTSSIDNLVNELQERYGREKVAGTIENFFSALAVRLVASGIRRIVVGGGETSGAVVKGLNLASLIIGEEISKGVPALVTSGIEEPLGLALKSGNFGGEDFFSVALDALGHD
ncbi:3-oxo-tetronate kinase [Sodalis sp. RH21]|uniref:3-oxo-tetronate kinase n=1 Tax=unclassified Sodalis (in: enterobacteria) TaxID=2636512 RepID=UPI0039B47439